MKNTMNGSKAAIVSQDGECVTYNDLMNFCELFAEHISDRMLLLIRCTISSQVIMAYTAAIKNHIPVIMIEQDNDCKSVMEQYAPSYIWQKSEVAAFEGYEQVWDWHGYVLLKRQNIVTYTINKELALLLSTSGSTGSEKFVRISYRNIECNTKAIIDTLRIKDNDIAMAMLPLSYTYGLSVVNTYLYSRATILVSSSTLIHKDFWEFFDKNGGTSIFGVPFTYEIIKKLNVFQRVFSSLKLATTAGGKISAENEQYMLNMSRKYGFNFASMYGLTEATARVSCYFLNEHPEKIGSVGQVVPNGRIEVQNGEIVYYGENVSMGYAVNYKDLHKGDDNKGVLRTGDVGVIDSDGYVYIKGRLKRYAKINGYRIGLDELENMLRIRLGVECGCIETDNIIYVAVQENLQSLAECAVLDELKDITGMHKKCFCVKFVKELPRGKNGKVIYRELLG